MNIFTLFCIIVPVSSMADNNIMDDLFDDGSADDNVMDIPEVANKSNSEFLNMSFYDMADISDSEIADATKNILLFREQQDHFFSPNTGYKTFKGTEDLNVLGDYTVMVWVYLEQRRTGWTRIFGKGNKTHPGLDRNFGLWVDSHGYPLSQSQCVTTGQNAINRKKGKVELNRWTLLSAVFRKNRVHTLFMNGRLVKMQITKGNQCKSNYPIMLGGGWNHAMHGHTQEARLYNRAIGNAQSFKNFYLRFRATSVPTSRPTPRPTGTPTPSPTIGQFGTIYQLLQSLIDEGNAEIDDMDKVVKDLEAEVKRLQGLVIIDRTNEAVCLEKKDEAYGLLEKAKGVAKSTCKGTNETKLVLEKEIKLFEKVIQLLKALSNGEKLVEEDQDEVKSFISLADQANPTKVKNVMTLVEGLIATANADIAKAVKDCGAANAAVLVAWRVYNEALGTCVPLTSKLAKTERSLQNAQGKLETAKEHAVRRTPLIQSEIESLKEVISLIRSVD